jgi:hypothetical protein
VSRSGNSASTQVLHCLNLFELYENDPDSAIESLRAALLAATSWLYIVIVSSCRTSIAKTAG